jgi:hypothetical protein
MANYSIDGQGTNTANTTLLYFVNHATTLHRLKLFEIMIGADVSADNAAESVIQRITAEAGTPGGSAVTPTPNDPADVAADSNAVEDPSSEPTYTSNLILVNLPGHQRATILWAPAEGREVIAPATGDNGMGFRVITCATPWNQVVHMRYSE